MIFTFCKHYYKNLLFASNCSEAIKLDVAENQPIAEVAAAVEQISLDRLRFYSFASILIGT